MSRKLNFDALARPYKWLEYLTFGRSLENCRFRFLRAAQTSRHALIFGDGDGRFAARLLSTNKTLVADIIDISPAMLNLLSQKLTPEARARVRVYEADAREFDPPAAGYGLVISHFFLDCLTAAEIDSLLRRIAPRLEPGALWIVSEFAVPSGPVASRAGMALIRVLYEAFGLITGLPVRSLPDYEKVMANHGFKLLQEERLSGGLLVSQIWQYLPQI